MKCDFTSVQKDYLQVMSNYTYYFGLHAAGNVSIKFTTAEFIKARITYKIYQQEQQRSMCV